MDKNLIITFFFQILLVSSFFSLLNYTSNIKTATTNLGNTPITAGGSGTLPIGLNYSWSEDRMSVKQVTVWDDVSYVSNNSGEYLDSGVDYFVEYTYVDVPYPYSLIYPDGNYWVDVENTWERDYKYSSFSNTTISGNNTLSANLDIYNVSAKYSDKVQLQWLAVKNGTWQMDYYLNKFNKTYSVKYDVYSKSHIRGKLHDVPICPWIDYGEYIYDQVYWFNSSKYPIPKVTGEVHVDAEFTVPIILTLETYNTTNDVTVAWAEMIANYIVFNDTDYDGIYLAGLNMSNPSGIPDLMYSNEFVGYMSPMALNVYIDVNATYGPVHEKWKKEWHFPRDKSIKDFVDKIEFSPPVAASNDKISWDILYPDYPIFGEVGKYNPSKNATKDNTSPGNFSFGYDYQVSSYKADLYSTIRLPKLTNTTLYNATKGLGLSIPHYSYFMSSYQVNQTVDNSLTIPADLFGFTINDTIIAQIDTNNPVKAYYTLYDFPNLGDVNQYLSRGATVNVMATEATKLTYSTNAIEKNPFASMILSLANFTKGKSIPSEKFNETYCIETINYPMWSGNKLVHDPIFTSFYGPIPSGSYAPPFSSGGGDDDDDGGKEKPAIPGYSFQFVFLGTIIGLITLLVLIKKEKKINI